MSGSVSDIAFQWPRHMSALTSSLRGHLTLNQVEIRSTHNSWVGWERLGLDFCTNSVERRTWPWHCDVLNHWLTFQMFVSKQHAACLECILTLVKRLSSVSHAHCWSYCLAENVNMLCSIMLGFYAVRSWVSFVRQLGLCLYSYSLTVTQRLRSALMAICVTLCSVWPHL